MASDPELQVIESIGTMADAIDYLIGRGMPRHDAETFVVRLIAETCIDVNEHPARREH